jgi:hypothetical protein
MFPSDVFLENCTAQRTLCQFTCGLRGRVDIFVYFLLANDKYVDQKALDIFGGRFFYIIINGLVRNIKLAFFLYKMRRELLGPPKRGAGSALN